MIMLKTLWTTGIVALVGLTLLLTPETSDAQRGGGRGGGGRGGGGGGRGGGGGGGEWREGRGRGWDRGWGWGWGAGIGWGYPGYGYYGGYYPRYYGAYDDGYLYSDPQLGSQYSLYPDSQYADATQSGLTNANDAGFIVRVPDPNAEVFFQDYKTQQRGTIRHFESDSLDPNKTYTFQIRARWMQNGQQMDQTRQVQARAGQNVRVDFANSAIQQPPNEQIPTPPSKTQSGQQSSTNAPQ
jgi:uncharacterized protein (TIGR03000 family)